MSGRVAVLRTMSKFAGSAMLFGLFHGVRCKPFKVCLLYWCEILYGVRCIVHVGQYY